MSEAVQNRCGCPTPVVTNVPGTAGASACTNITADFSVPAFGNNVTVYVVDNSQMVVGTIVMADAPAHFEVISLTGATQCVLQFVNQSGDVAPGTTITVGAKLCPSAGQGTAGVDGKNGYATSTGFNVPGSAGDVIVIVDDSSVLSVGVYVAAQTNAPGIANFIVKSIASSTSVTLTFLDNPGDDAGGTVPNPGILIPVGKSGQDAFTNFVSSMGANGNNIVPSAAGFSMTAIVGSTAWMVQGELVVLGSTSSGFGPATFQVTSISNSTTVVLTWLAYSLDVAAGTSIPGGTGVSPTGTQLVNSSLAQTAYASGSVYTLTGTSQILAFGGAQPTITLPNKGTWIILAQVLYDTTPAYSTTAGVVTTLLQRLVNTPGVVGNSLIAQAFNYTNAGITQDMTVEIPLYVYQTTTDGDVIQIWASQVNVAGTAFLNAKAASIVAFQIA
jgi:hypothetical protein